MSTIEIPLKLALLTSRMSPAAGGLSVSIPSLASGLSSYEDFDVYLIGTQDPACPNAYKDWAAQVTAFPVSWPHQLQRSSGMAAALSRIQPDVVDVQGLWGWSSHVSFSHWRRTGTPYVVTPRGMLDPWALGNSKWKKKLFSAFVENAHLRNAFCLRATANLEAEHFRGLGLTQPIAVVPNSVEIPPLLERSPSERRKLLFLSRVNPKKGISLLLQAWSRLESIFLDWDLLIAGIDEDGYQDKMQLLAKELKLLRVNFVGPFHGNAKHNLYRNSDLFVLPTYAENFGLVVAEALAQEVPVITTTNAPWTSLNSRRCGWCIDLTLSNLTDILSQAMALPPSELQAMGSRGRRFVDDAFSPAVISQQMRQLYLWAVNRSSKPDFIYF